MGEVCPALENSAGKPSGMGRLWSRLSLAWHGLETRRQQRRLRLLESVALGEKRFVAVVQFETQQFLIGGGATSVCLLARLGESPDFAEVLTEWCERQR